MYPQALMAAHQRLLTFLAEQSDADLYGNPMVGGGNARISGRWAEAAGPSPYRLATEFIRSTLRAVF